MNINSYTFLFAGALVYKCVTQHQLGNFAMLRLLSLPFFEKILNNKKGSKKTCRIILDTYNRMNITLFEHVVIVALLWKTE